MEQEFIFDIAPDGTTTAVYSDDLVDFFDGLGKVTTIRASSVEPHLDGGWTADMGPIEKGVVLGPFRLREEALAAEREWLEQRLFS
jgi:hypothetical protein